jgi:hypothetical protein
MNKQDAIKEAVNCLLNCAIAFGLGVLITLAWAA